MLPVLRVLLVSVLLVLVLVLVLVLLVLVLVLVLVLLLVLLRLVAPWTRPLAVVPAMTSVLAAPMEWAGAARGARTERSQVSEPWMRWEGTW